MKHSKRVLAMLLGIVLILTSLNGAVFGSALAEEEDLPENRPVIAPNNDLLRMGEWIYWVEDGFAYIAGYGNASEDSLKIPNTLDGYVVTGIASGAFKNMAALKSVQIPTHVTAIASDAFDGLNGITVKAYHGAYALDYAASHGMNTSDQTSSVKLSSGVVDMNGFPSGIYSSLNENSVNIKTDYAAFLRVGQILYFSKTSAFPSGLARRVSGISRNGNTTRVDFSVPEWDEVIERAYGEENLYVDWEHATWADGFEPMDVGDSKSDTISFNKTKTLSSSFKSKNGKFNVTGSITLGLSNASVSYNIVKEWWGIIPYPSISKLVVKLPFVINPHLSVTFKSSGSASKDLLQTPKPSEGESGTKDIGTVPVYSDGVCNASLVLKLYYSINCDMEIDIKLIPTITFNYINGKLTVDKSFNASSSFDLEGGFELGAELHLTFGLNILSVLKFNILDGFVRPKIVGKGSLKSKNVTGASKYVMCGDITINPYIDFGIKVGAVDKEVFGTKLYYEYKKTNVALGGWSYHGHWDDFKAVKSCVLSGRKIEFQSNGKTVSSTTYNVNDKIKEPSKPTRSGYRFDGWYVDASASGLSGSDYKFNFSTGKMPYLKNNKTFVLYAKWTWIPVPGATEPPVTPKPATPTPKSTGVTPAPTATPTPTPTPIPVTSITLNQNTWTAYTNDTAGLQLAATVQPGNAADRNVRWTSSDESVVVVNQGLVGVVGQGTAVITCSSVSNPNVSATCAVTVKQYVEEISIDGSVSSLLPGETEQLSAVCYPTAADNRSVAWSTDNASVATVSSSGLVKAVGYGTAKITAAAVDGSGVKAEYTVTVEKELQPEVSQVNTVMYTQGTNEAVLAYVSLSNASAVRMAKQGLTPVWTLEKKSGSGDAILETVESTLNDNGIDYNTVSAVLLGNKFPQAGTEVWTVTCQAGSFSESVDISTTVKGGVWASSLKLTNASVGANTLTCGINTQIQLPMAPYSGDGAAVPSGLTLSVRGDKYYMDQAIEEQNGDSITVTFAESGIYSPTLHYTAGNLAWDVAATIRVADADGTVHLKAEEVVLNHVSADLVQGETLQLNAEVAPSDAYNKTVTWKSLDTSVATVSSSGRVKAVAPGHTVIICTAADGSGCMDVCSVSVEKYLQLDEAEIASVVYLGGDDHVELGIVNLTVDTQKRIEENKDDVTWNLTKASGTATEVGLYEFGSTAADSVAVTGNGIRLIRMNEPGTDAYTLSCSAGGYTDSCSVTITVKDANLPKSITLKNSACRGTVGEIIALSDAITVSPTGSSLPDDVEISVEGGNAFRNALSADYDYLNPKDLIFDKAGVYPINVVFSGTNYSYTCPVTVTVADETGNVPEIITEVSFSESIKMMFAGETVNLGLTILPSGATHSAVTYVSSDTSVATVSASGKVTAIGAGVAEISATIPESDEIARCMVVVEDGLTFRDSSLERTVFVDGQTRTRLGTVLLTESSSLRLTEAPEWTLTRISGNSLTLKAESYETLSADGNKVYGCTLNLFSVSKIGNTVYELTCTSGSESITMPITVYAVDREGRVPASLEIAQTVYTADVGELISVRPEVSCYPAGIELPAGIRVSFEGDAQYLEALNAEDCFFSQSISTFSFGIPGTYQANCILTYSNVKYVIPFTFRVKDEYGDVPVQGNKVTLSAKNVALIPGETLQLTTAFTPVDTSDQRVTYTSSDPSVVTVTANGLLTAVSNGSAIITCTPSDTRVQAVQCAVTVEDALTVETGATSAVLYKQGKQMNTVSFAMLSEGTVLRLQNADVTPVWSVDTQNATHSDIEYTVNENGTGLTVQTKALNSKGTDYYTVSCTAGEWNWTQEYTLRVIDLGVNTPTAVSAKQSTASVQVGQTVTLDFTPVITPSGVTIPSGMETAYVGIGDFYNALDYSVYSENGDKVTAAFTKPGVYVLARRYILRNLSYVETCKITVGNIGEDLGLLNATEKEFTVYTGGKSGTVSTISLKDAMIGQLWENDLQWNAERISGDSITAALKVNGNSADLFVANTLHTGTDIWRVSCTFGGYTESVDITLTAAIPRGEIPESLTLAKDHFSGVTGEIISVPLGVECDPSGSMLPDQGDEFWSFSLDQQGEERSVYSIGDGLLKITFARSGYYSGELKYQSGNVAYCLPVYFTVLDEEGEIEKPELSMYLVNPVSTVYPEGDINVVMGQAIICEGLSTYATGSAVAYMDSVTGAEWKVTVNGSAAALKLQKRTANVYDLTLTEIKTSGDISYTISCVVGGKTYKATGSLHVASADEQRPDATLAHNAYSTQVGLPVIIENDLYDRADGSILQSASEWDPSRLLEAVGYEWNQSDKGWTMTFYTTGNYTADVTGYVGNLKLSVPVNITVTPKGQEASLTVLLLPGNLEVIEEEAFSGTCANVADLRGTCVKTISSRAFAGCVDLVKVYLPSGISYIADDAFYGCLNAVFCCEEGSYAAAWVARNGLAAE